MHDLCDRRLIRWYRRYNERFFGDRLPHDIDVLYAPIEGCSGEMIPEDTESFIIRINPKHALDFCNVQRTLLHEMNHVDLWPYCRHGKRFNDGMLRLAIAGAMGGLW